MITYDLLRRLPKAELHVHLDGSVRPETMIELAADAAVPLPWETPERLAAAMKNRNAQSLEEALEVYEYTVAVMQTPAALERIAYEFVLDVWSENVWYVEARYCPALHTTTMSLAQAIEAPIAGLRRGQAETGCRTAIIITALRSWAPSISDDLARAAVDYRRDGVVAFDLGGGERGNPARDHAGAFAYAAQHGLHRTCHAGEGDGPASVWQALHECGAQRIGHGVRTYEAPEVEAFVRDHGIPLEVCLTSNLNTNTVSRIAEHPFRRYLDGGCVVTLNTDSRLVDGVSLTDEFWLAHRAFGVSREEIDRLILHAFQSAFLADEDKSGLVSRVAAELEAL